MLRSRLLAVALSRDDLARIWARLSDLRRATANHRDSLAYLHFCDGETCC